MSLASKLPWTRRFAGGFPGLSSQRLLTDADAIDYLTRMATADGAGVEVGVAVAVNRPPAAMSLNNQNSDMSQKRVAETTIFRHQKVTL